MIRGHRPKRIDRRHRSAALQGLDVDGLLSGAAVCDEATRKRLGVLGGDIPDKPNRGPQPFLALVKSEIARWSPIIKAANVKIE